MSVVTIGIDAHKKTHTLVAVDGVGRRLAELTVPATTAGHLRIVQWAAAAAAAAAAAGQAPGPVRFAVEDCRHLTRRLEGDLLRAGQPVVRVHTRLMAGARRGGRRPGQVRPNRRRGGGAGVPARAGPADRAARWAGPGGQAAGRRPR